MPNRFETDGPDTKAYYVREAALDRLVEMEDRIAEMSRMHERTKAVVEEHERRTWAAGKIPWIRELLLLIGMAVTAFSPWIAAWLAGLSK